jgi:hypothetical protein
VLEGINVIDTIVKVVFWVTNPMVAVIITSPPSIAFANPLLVMLVFD